MKMLCLPIQDVSEQQSYFSTNQLVIHVISQIVFQNSISKDANMVNKCVIIKFPSLIVAEGSIIPHC